MTLPSQFSLEEENFYKDIQDLVKKGSQNGRELSMFLERYKDLLARADLDDETFIINFAKAGLIIEASAKVYGIKVDSLWIHLEHVLESLKNKGSLQGNKKKLDGENEGELDGAGGGCDDLNEDDEKRKGLGFGRRRKKLGDALFSSDDFLEIDSITGLLGKNMNESSSNAESKIKLCEKIPNMFIKTKTKKKKIDVCLNKSCLDKDVIRLRDWIISAECLLVKEIYTQIPDSVFSHSRTLDQERRVSNFESEVYRSNDEIVFNDKEVSMVQESIRLASCLRDERNNNLEANVGTDPSLKAIMENEKLDSAQMNDSFVNCLNVSRESDVAKFPNVLERGPGDCLVDVDEVFWNPSKFQDVIPSKKRRAGKTNKLSCQLCVDKKLHSKKGKKCLENKKLECLDSYFSPHVQPTLTESQFGILPDEELYSAYKAEMKLIEQLKKVDSTKNTNGAYFPDESPEELVNFLGFDGFENSLIKKPELLEEQMPTDNVLFEAPDNDEEDEHFVEDINLEKDVDLPFPELDKDGNAGISMRVAENLGEPRLNDNLENAEVEYQKLVTEELKEHYAAKSSFAKNKELGARISKWFEMIGDKIKLSQKRGALNMKMLASKIMGAFPSDATEEDKPVMTFQNLVKNRCRRDVPRYFFACLQLANEGNLGISKSTDKSLATDCMLVTRLRAKVVSRYSDEHSVLSPSKDLNSSKNNVIILSKRKRNSSDSSSTADGKIRGKQKRQKQRLLKPCKRPKNFNSSSAGNKKKRRCSTSSVDSLASE